MKKLFTLFALLISFNSFSQVPVNLAGIQQYGWVRLGLVVDSMIVLPYRDTIYTSSDYPAMRKIGRMVMRPQDKRLYLWNGMRWIPVNTFTSAQETKLNSIQSGATANQSDAYLLDRGHHTGTQPASTVTGLSQVATTGNYYDLSGLPVMSNYISYSDTGNVAHVATSYQVFQIADSLYDMILDRVKVEVDPTVPDYSKGLTSFAVIKMSTDPLYKPIGYAPSNSEVIAALGGTPLFSEVDGSTTNEIELPTQSGNTGKFLQTNGSSASWQTALTSEVDGSTTNEIQSLSGSGNQINLSGGGGSYTIPNQPYSSLTGVPATFPPSAHTHPISGVTGLSDSLIALRFSINTKEPSFSKNSAFNKNFGSASGTVAEGSDSRIVNGQTAFSWGNHASAGYMLQTQGVPNSRTISINFNGTAVTQDLSANRTFTITEVDGSTTNEIELPAQSGQNGKFLTTNGSTPSWSAGPGQPNLTAGQNTKITGTYPNLTISDSSSLRVYNTSGRINQSIFKIWTDVIVPTTGNGYSVDISSASFSTILSVMISSETNTGSTTTMRNVELKSYTTTAAVVNAAVPNATNVSLVGLTLLGVPSFLGSGTGTKFHLTVIGY